MIEAGDVYLADLGLETRRHALVVSNRRFHQHSGRALVCPRMSVVPSERFPWWIDAGDATFALDRLASLPLDRLLDRTDRLSADQFAVVRRALVAIT